MGSSNNARTADIQHHYHPVTSPTELRRDGPSLVTKGEGIRLTIDGRELFDGFAGLGCAAIGYGNEEVAAAAYSAMKRLSFCHSFWGQGNPDAALLSKKLSELTNGDFDTFFFASTGSDANESAIKIIYYYWKLRNQPTRKILLARNYAYHGNTVLTTVLSGIHHYHEQFDLPISGVVHHVDAPYWYRYGNGKTAEEQGAEAAASLERKILELGAENVAAFFVEPIQGAGGIIMPTASYLKQVAEICKRHDILLVSDEVITGFGKTGSMFAYQHYGFQPDILVVAKGITSAYFPLSAVGLGAKVADVLTAADEMFVHGFTNSGHPVGAAVALANIDVIEKQKLLEHVTKDLHPALNSWMQKFSRHPAVGEARSVGVIAALDFSLGQTEEEQTAFCEAVSQEARNRGFIARAIGPVLGMIFPLITTVDELNACMAILESSLDATYALTVAEAKV
ncbi:aminotransferase family protein [Paraburkholderia bannensis]|uniref:aminotransferase family protein n=1 Tax=Paraburkholderia bannensis TaxID=765414 RepID=UPI002AAFE4C2|nr:aminotransferase class III-fold pyridoxal phosphate-dependent enzyme [Paraburkholderia bannensis]